MRIKYKQENTSNHPPNNVAKDRANHSIFKLSKRNPHSYCCNSLTFHRHPLRIQRKLVDPIPQCFSPKHLEAFAVPLHKWLGWQSIESFGMSLVAVVFALLSLLVVRTLFFRFFEGSHSALFSTVFSWYVVVDLKRDR
jgi:hypothetical protein